jgi:DNA polymerase-3 subunit epsilon
MSKHRLYQTKAACFQYKIKSGAGTGMVSTEEYNLRVSAFITNNSFENQMVIVEKGRTQ